MFLEFGGNDKKIHETTVIMGMKTDSLMHGQDSLAWPVSLFSGQFCGKGG